VGLINQAPTQDTSNTFRRYIKHVHKINQVPLQHESSSSRNEYFLANQPHAHGKKEGSDLHNFYNFSFFSQMLKSLSLSFGLGLIFEL